MPPGGNTTESSQFGKVLEEWLTKHCRDNHKDHGHEARRILTKELPQQWWSRPIASISRDDCAKVIEGIVERGHQAQAHNLFGYMRTLFTWAVQSAGWTPRRWRYSVPRQRLASVAEATAS